jgi:hypothetical protein
LTIWKVNSTLSDMESNGGTTDAAGAAAQLAALQAARAELADRVVQPWWWDAAFGLLLFGFFSSYAAHSAWVVAAAAVPLLGGFLVLKAVYQRISGTWWDARRVGPVQGRVRRAMRWWLVAYLGVYGLGCAVEYLLDVRGAMVVAGAVLGCAAALLSHWVSTIYAAGLRAGL